MNSLIPTAPGATLLVFLSFLCFFSTLMGKFAMLKWYQSHWGLWIMFCKWGSCGHVFSDHLQRQHNRPWSHIAKDQIPALRFSCFVTLSKLLRLSEPQFPHLASGNANCTYLKRPLVHYVLQYWHLVRALHVAFPTASQLLSFSSKKLWGTGVEGSGLIVQP